MALSMGSPKMPLTKWFFFLELPMGLTVLNPVHELCFNYFDNAVKWGLFLSPFHP